MILNRYLINWCTVMNGLQSTNLHVKVTKIFSEDSIAQTYSFDVCGGIINYF